MVVPCRTTDQGEKRKKRSKKADAKKGQKMSVKCLITLTCM